LQQNMGTGSKGKKGHKLQGAASRHSIKGRREGARKKRDGGKQDETSRRSGEKANEEKKGQGNSYTPNINGVKTQKN